MKFIYPKLIITIFLFITFLLTVFIACDIEPKYTDEEWKKIQEEQQKQYEITTYDLSDQHKLILTVFMNDPEGKLLWSYNSVQEFLKDIINGKANIPEIFGKIKEDLIKNKNTYYAKQIINYSDTDVRFIESDSNKELFITADYIQVSRIK